MTKDQLRKFIKDTRGLILGAPPEKKIKYLSLIKEAKRKYEEAELQSMELDEEKLKETLSSKYSTASLAGALSQAGATIKDDSQNTEQINTDYLEEK
jgi:hypothetical protein